MAPIDNGEERIERASSEISRAAGQEVTRAAVRILGQISAETLPEALRAAATSIKWTRAAVFGSGGKVSMKELSEQPSRTPREVVSLDDKEVMRALETNLRKRGVHYAVEREKVEGQIQHILHVRGDDAQVVADSLERAAAAVDTKRERKQERVDNSPKVSRDSEASPQQSQKPSAKAPANETGQKSKELRQRELRERVKGRAAQIQTQVPQRGPKLDTPTPRLKR